MLTLDPTTLFYWDIIHDLTTPRFNTNNITQWVDSLPREGNAKSQASSLSKHSISSAAPSLTNQSTITTSLVHTFDLSNAKHLLHLMIHVKPEPNNDFKMGDIQGNEGPWNYYEDGIISERDLQVYQSHILVASPTTIYHMEPTGNYTTTYSS